MGLRLLDVENRVWSDHWVNARSGVVMTPGQTGSFENGACIFVTDDVGQPVKYAGVWDNITPASCRWRQASTARGRPNLGSELDHGMAAGVALVRGP